MKAEWIAPCGMNCRLCYGFIRQKTPCLGCRGAEESKPKSCTACKIVVCEKRNKNSWDTCALCDAPCRRLKDLDKRYRTKYHMSMVENLAHIQEKGMENFLQQQRERFTCPECGEIVCVHRDTCPSCKTAVWDGME